MSTGPVPAPVPPRRSPGRSALVAAAAGMLALGGLAGLATPAGAVAAGVATAPAGPAGATTPGGASGARPGDLLDVTLDQVRPTQPSVGYDEVYYKLGRYTSPKDELNGAANKRFDDWCETNGQGVAATVLPGARLADPATFTCTVPLGQETEASRAEMKTVVVGPGGALYLTDGHHTLTSFLEAPDGGPELHLRLIVQANLSDLSPAAFWQEMRARNWVRLIDEQNRPITVEQLPQHLGLAYFHDDPYRSLVYFTRDIGYSVPDGAAEYLEFLWGDWLRGQGIGLPGSYSTTDRTSYLAAVRTASQAMSAVPGDTVITGGRTADELGRLNPWNAGKKPTGGEFGKLSAPITEAKPGKLAYALDFRAKVPTGPACTETVTGRHTGPLVVSRGTTCLTGARQTGPVVVRAGASLVVKGSDITGPVQAVGAGTVQLCGTVLTGPLSVVNTRDHLTLAAPGCTPNTLNGPVQLVGNPTS
ncbi:ParB/Srx family N-terminal domain-containing protein [Streptomyces sp. BE303]|uniref:ParB/Srx family N-terminal domain-containing protein n=1 Tax=Streptomyces sp. BE303 TaxID=3002528 RepID=UPI002E7713EA|nr:ParB/Srx family N-terminal domain-containing protein [Streptomyces sp. BE303]MED7955037.1 ParB/Srx family N-terminal domain-containing protein [Streptomyces sp. BE303]